MFISLPCLFSAFQRFFGMVAQTAIAVPFRFQKTQPAKHQICAAE
jgi:hypothetical protein